jgi:hypothetical protein
MRVALKAVRRQTSRQTRKARRQALTGAALIVVAISTLTLFAGLGVRQGAGCSTCHVMRPFTEAHSETVHSEVSCAACHATRGSFGVFADGTRAAGWTLSYVFGGKPQSGGTSEQSCRACHESVMTETIVSKGIRVRHGNFETQACGHCHAGTAHRAEGRWYRPLEMDDCMGCHKGAANDPKSCEVCHVGDAQRREGTTAWRSTHGPDWQKTHGMGDLKTCSSCHEKRVCVDCHGVLVPHPTEWIVRHGRAALTDAGEGCGSCHQPDWCDKCHGLPMPHAPEFLPQHDIAALESGSESCKTCHDPLSCDYCHFASSHPSIPGVGMGHGE